jgi:hypothetical protein
MANIGLWAQKNMLDWVLLGAVPTRPPGTYVGLSLGAPTYQSMSEVAAGSGYSRIGAASNWFTPATTGGGVGTSWNATAATFGPFSSSGAISGLTVVDNATSAAPNILWYGNLATPRTPLTGDSLVLASSALVITLS